MARRNGIFKRQDGRWSKCLTLGGKRRTLYGHTAQEVQDQVDEARHLAKRGRIVTGTRQTVEQFLDEWLATMQPPKVRESTYTKYGVHIRRALPAIGAMKLTRLRDRHLELCYADLNKTYAPRTVRAMHAILHQAFQKAVKWDLLARNPAEDAELPQLGQPDVRPFSREQVRILLEGTAGTRWYAFYVVMSSTGLRIAEGAGLEWTDVDERAGHLSIRRQLVRMGGRGMVSAPLKSKKSFRDINVPPGVLLALKKHRAIQAKERLKVGAEWEDREQAIIGAHNLPLRETLC